MKRKVVRHGKNTMTVSLPAKWVRNNKITNGQFLLLKEADNELVVSNSEMPFEKTEITLSSSEDWYVSMIIRHLYICGYDEVKIIYNGPNMINIIRKSLKELTGLEILESNPNYAILRVIASLDNVEYDSLVDRAFWLVLSQFDYFIEDNKKGKPLMYEEIEELFYTVSKLVNLCRRTINKNNIYDPIISKYAYSFVTSLRYISSFILFCYQYCKKNNKMDLTPKELDLLIKTKEYFYQLLLAYKNLDIKKTKEFFEDRDRNFGDFLEVLKEKNPAISLHLIQAMKYMAYIGNFILSLDFLKRSKF
jgi:phosphate uptake regulator